MRSSNNYIARDKLRGMTELAQKKCVACEEGTAPLSRAEAEALLAQLPYWNLTSDARSINKTFKFKDWKEAMAFVRKISEIAEAEGHHPDIDLHWGRVGVSLTTHAVKGLSENDFIVAAKIDLL